MATYTTTSGAALGDIPLSTLMVDKDAVVEIVSGSASGVVDTVSGMIATAVSTVWKAGGSVAASGSGSDDAALLYKSGNTWTAPLLKSGNEGKVYHLTEDYDIVSGTSSFFKEGTDTHIVAGTDVAVIYDEDEGKYVYDVLAVTDSSVVKKLIAGYGGTEITPFDGGITVGGAGGISVRENSGDLEIDGSSILIAASGAVAGLYNFSTVSVSEASGSVSIVPASNSDTLHLLPGSNITLSGNSSDKSITINATGAPESSGFAHVTVGSVTIDADAADDILTISGTTPIVASGDATNDKVTISHATCGPSSSADTSKGDTSNQTPGFGSGFKVTNAVVDKYGHTKTLNEHTVTIPNATATTSGNGLMSSTDKSKLNGISSGANIGFNTVLGANDTSASITSGNTNLVLLGTNISASVYLQSGDHGPVVADFSVPDGSTTTKGVVKIASAISDQGTVVPTASMVSAAISGITHPVTDGKISGGSSLLSGTTIVIPVATTSAKGVTQLTDSVSNSTTTAITPNAVSGVKSGLESGLATKVTGSSLHNALANSGLASGTGSTNNTIYALLNALHSVDGQHS